MRVEGRCHCGAIAYEAEVEPGTLTICHCLDCQRISGSAFRTNIQAPASSFRILTGQPRQYVKIANSGARRVQGFCENCGSPIYSCAEENPQTYSLRAGTLNQSNEIGGPAREIWTKRRLSWVPACDGIAEAKEQS